MQKLNNLVTIESLNIGFYEKFLKVKAINEIYNWTKNSNMWSTKNQEQKSVQSSEIAELWKLILNVLPLKKLIK